MRSVSLLVRCGWLFVLPLLGATQGSLYAASGVDLLSNPSFEIPGLLGPATTFTGKGFAGPSAAANWSLYSNHEGTLDTELVPSTLPGGGVQMLHIMSNAAYSGVVQVFGPYDTGPHAAEAQVSVWVVRGKVGLGTGNGGATDSSKTTTTLTDQWVTLKALQTGTHINEIVVYALSADGAEFYVDAASVIASWIPGDVDDNGVVDIRDAVQAAQIAQNPAPPANAAFERADCEPLAGIGGHRYGDGSVGTPDVQMILRIASGTNT